MIELTPPMYSRNVGTTNTRRFATCWAIERTDGTTMRVTDHNSSLTVNGFTYSATSGFSTSARERGGNFQERNAEVVGFLNSNYITEEDLRAGRYQDARVIELVVDALVPWAGIFSTTIYYIQEISFTGEFWQAQVVGLTERIRRPRGDAYGRLCRWDLGSEFATNKAGCKVDLESLSVSGTVSSVTTQRVAMKTDLTAATGYFNRGVLLWTSGANLNLQHEIQSYNNTDGKIVFFLHTPYDIDPGDTFDVTPGCDKTLETCLDKFNNVANFGGFPYIPGTDRILRTPDPK